MGMTKIITFTADDEIQAMLNDLQFRWSLDTPSGVIRKSIRDHHKSLFGGNQTLTSALQGGK